MYLVGQCVTLMTINHIIRQRNGVADSFAFWAHFHLRRIEVFRRMDMPVIVRRCYDADKIGLFFFRSHNTC